ncbi:unnamed protein product [Lathyrus sativus]|nr:unnamed protein product [Lathyrus sativus]
MVPDPSSLQKVMSLLILFFSIFYSLNHGFNFVSTADIISAIEFDKSGDRLATDDRGGRVVLFERTDSKDQHASRKDLKSTAYSNSRHPEFRYKRVNDAHPRSSWFAA